VKTPSGPPALAQPAGSQKEHYVSRSVPFRRTLPAQAAELLLAPGGDERVTQHRDRVKPAAGRLRWTEGEPAGALPRFMSVQHPRVPGPG
jgi:hypothetical protein